MLQWSDKHDNIVDVVNNNDNIVDDDRNDNYQCDQMA